MLFNSVAFSIFFPVVILTYFLLAARYRWLWLLAASYYFYMSWRAEYILLILISTSVDYFAAQRMSQVEDPPQRRRYLILSLVSNLGLLFVFKYYNFFGESITSLAQLANVDVNVLRLDVLLPVGISFYTFQTLSYTIDVYNGKIQPENNYGIFALFVAFFPQLVAGPIERPSKLLPQLRQLDVIGNFDYARVTEGLRLMLWGFFKKVVIADRLAIYVNLVFNAPEGQPAILVATATLFFAFQIYCDFSGYSDIAIGVAKVLGVDLTINFRRPYLSRSIAEFWRRWHITLSTWFRDYVYIPLGGNRVSLPRWHINILIVFLVSGLWHGASWTFAIWGLIHGVTYLIMHWVGTWVSLWMKQRGITKLPFQPVITVLQISIVFVIVCVAWIFFRANTVDDAFLLIRQLTLFSPAYDFSVFRSYWVFDSTLMVSFVLIGFLMTVEVLQGWVQLSNRFIQLPATVRFAVYYLAIMAITVFGMFGEEATEFVYFQF